MNVVGKVESLWRYPVKSMCGEQLEKAFVGFPGVYGDRAFAFQSSAAPKGFPYLTGREQEQMLLYRPAYRYPESLSQPPNLAEAEALPPGVTPVYADSTAFSLDVRTPEGEMLAINDPLLISRLRNGIRERHELTLLRSHRAMTDCRPVSLFSTQTAMKLAAELKVDIDKRRFRANIYLDLQSGNGFEEDGFVGRTLRIGPKAMISVTDRDPRCKMITLDPDTAQANPDVIKNVVRFHCGSAGVYGVVLVEGTVSSGDEILLVN